MSWSIYALRTPEILAMVLPIVFLLALLYALTDMARHHELTAMRAAGVSLWRIALPYFAVGFLLSVTVFALNELWVPESIELAKAAKHRHKSDLNASSKNPWKRQLGFVNTRQKRKWFMEAYNVKTYEMVQPHVEWILTTGTRCEIWAERAFYQDGLWVFTNVQEQVFTTTPGEILLNKTNSLIANFSETPEEIQSEIKISNINDLREVNRTQLSLREIWNYKNLHAETSSKASMLNTKLHGRLASPWTCLVVVLIALPFGAATGRRNVFVGVASSIVICFAFYVLQHITLALGTRGSIPPWLAGWAPNLIFGFTAIFLIYRVR